MSDMNRKIKRDIADCTASLAAAVTEAGGRFDPETLKMPLGDFIAEVAGQNGIRFIYRKPKEGKA